MENKEKLVAMNAAAMAHQAIKTDEHHAEVS